MGEIRRFFLRPAVVAVGFGALALVVRLWMIRAYSPPAPYDGGYDLHIYAYFGHLAAAGNDPYTAPQSGPIPGVYGDNQPLELLLFGGLLKLYNSLVTLRVFFALLESAVVALVGLTFRDRSLRWRIGVMTILAFNPFILLAWTGHSEDKSISIVLLALVILFVRTGRLRWAWAAAAVLLILKFEGLFIVLPLLIATWKRHGRWPTIGAACAFAASAMLAEAPFFPHSLVAFQRRSARIDYVPGDSSWTTLVNRIGLYDHSLIRPTIVVALLAVSAAFLKNWIRLDQAVALSFFFAFFFLPDQSADRIALIVVPLLLTMSLTRAQLLTIWIASLVSTVALMAADYQLIPLSRLLPFNHLRSSFYVPDQLMPHAVDSIVGAYGSVPFVILANVFLLAGIVFYARDLWHPTADRTLPARELQTRTAS